MGFLDDDVPCSRSERLPNTMDFVIRCFLEKIAVGG